MPDGPGLGDAGWRSLGRLLDGDALAAARAEAERVVDAGVRAARYPSRDAALRVVQKWPLAWDGPLGALVRRPDVAAALRAAVGVLALRGVGLSLITKPAGASLVVPWHRDQEVWPTDDRRGVTLWLGLDDADPAAGGLRYLPGSHLAESLPVDGPDPVAPATVAGEALVHHGRLWHTTGPNRSAHPRRALVAAVVPADAPARDGPWNPAVHPRL